MTTLRDTLHDNIFNAGRPAKQIADEIGISYSYLASAGNPNLEEFHFQLKHLIPLTKATGCFDALDYIERTLGRVAFTVPALDTDVSAVAAEVGGVAKEFSHLMLEMSKALADGNVQSHEWPAIARECEHLINVVCRLREAAKQEAAK
jgi:hypothetical protein